MKPSRVVLGLAILFLAPALAPAQDTDQQAVVLKLQEEVSQLRGLPFKTKVTAATQTQEGFAAYLDEQIGDEVPAILNQHYGAIVKRLGLYRGTLDNFSDTAKAVMTAASSISGKRTSRRG